MAAGPEHESVYLQVRDMILCGEIEPGEPVTIHGLEARTGAGMTPVREAIRRLMAEGALQARGNRRVAVPSMCARKLDEIRFARTCIEPRLAELAAPNLNDIDIDELERIDDDLETAIRSGDVGAYLRGNFRFHFNLYAASGARILERVAMSLWLQVGPSLRIVCSTFGTSDLPDMHEETIAALRRRDRHLVANTIESDILQGMELIRQQLFSD